MTTAKERIEDCQTEVQSAISSVEQMAAHKRAATQDVATVKKLEVTNELLKELRQVDSDMTTGLQSVEQNAAKNAVANAQSTQLTR